MAAKTGKRKSAKRVRDAATAAAMHFVSVPPIRLGRQQAIVADLVAQSQTGRRTESSR